MVKLKYKKRGGSPVSRNPRDMQIVTFTTLQMLPRPHTKYATFGAHSASGGHHCWDFNPGLKEQ